VNDGTGGSQNNDSGFLSLLTDLLATPFTMATGWPLLLIVLVLLILVGLAAAALCNAANRRGRLAVFVGITAGLQTAQIVKFHLFCFAVVLWLVLGVAREPAPWRTRRWGAALLVLGCAGLLTSTVLVGEMVNSTAAAGQFMSLAAMAAILVGFGSRRDVRPLLYGLLATTTLASTMAILQFAHVLPYKVFLGTRRPIGLYTEPDWLGSFSAIGVFLAHRCRVWPRRGWLRTPLIFLHIVVLTLAAARAAWLAVLVVGMLAWIVVRCVGRDRVPHVPRLPGGYATVVAALVVAGVALAAIPTLRDTLVERLSGLTSDNQEVGVQARQQQTAALFELADESPVFGLGFSASGRVGISGKIAYLGQGENNLASNWILGWWVDGGVLSVPLMLLFLVAAARRLATTSGLVLCVVLVTSLFSNAMLIPIAWFALALALMDTSRPPDDNAGPHGDTRMRVSGASGKLIAHDQPPTPRCHDGRTGVPTGA
jgi:hypothetical protein